MRRREAGRGAVPAGGLSQGSRSGGVGAPPGSTMRPRQELADDPRVQPTKRNPCLFQERGVARLDPGKREIWDESAAWRPKNLPHVARREAPAAIFGSRTPNVCVFRRAIPSSPSSEEGRRPVSKETAEGDESIIRTPPRRGEEHARPRRHPGTKPALPGEERARVRGTHGRTHDNARREHYTKAPTGSRKAGLSLARHQMDS